MCNNCFYCSYVCTSVGIVYLYVKKLEVVLSRLGKLRQMFLVIHIVMLYMFLVGKNVILRTEY